MAPKAIIAIQAVLFTDRINARLSFIKNIGNTELITLFWINEAYNQEDADTYFIKV